MGNGLGGNLGWYLSSRSSCLHLFGGLSGNELSEIHPNPCHSKDDGLAQKAHSVSPNRCKQLIPLETMFGAPLFSFY